MSEAIGILGAVVLVAGALVLLALLRGIHNAALPGRLVERALERLPAGLRDRYAEEWRADLAALSRNPLGATVWALGLRRASLALSKQAGARRRRTLPMTRASLPQMALDAAALGVAYFAAYAVRFGGDAPATYQTMFERTLPFAIGGGLVCLALVGAYGTSAPSRTVKVYAGVGLATLAIVAYVALVQPVLITSSQGFQARNVPAGVCVIFAMSACALMALSRAAIALGRIARG